MVITIAGGGSTFTAGIVKSIALRREELEVDEIRLYDINKERQDKVAVVVDWVLHKELNTDIKLVVTTDVQQAYTDTSFVFAQMRVGGYAMREQDEKIPLRHGCVGQETCGCGGMAYGMRTIFPMIQLIDDVEKYAKKDYWIGNALFFFAGGVMSLLCLPCGKLSLAFLAVPAGKDGWVECPCQTVNDFIGIRGSVGGLFLFVQTHAPLTVPPWQSRARKSKF